MAHDYGGGTGRREPFMISINFASKNYRAFDKIFKLLIAGSIVLVCIAVILLWKSARLSKDLSTMQHNLEQAASGDDQVKSVLAERAQLVKDLEAMTGLIDARRFSWTQFLTSIESVVPVGVALKNLIFNPKDRILTLEGVAESPESLRNLMVGLEKSTYFADPLLKHQSLDRGTISFDVVAVYHGH